ncbi:hypothetical protein ACFC6L_02895 [Kitasatospora phosalacinea]|uniref:hypothetical protein n=1 Tax=Kitasatospora phosalacinea TaxID=2065 RepID=UPI0035E09C1C
MREMTWVVTGFDRNSDSPVVERELPANFTEDDAARLVGPRDRADPAGVAGDHGDVAARPSSASVVVGGFAGVSTDPGDAGFVPPRAVPDPFRPGANSPDRPTERR